MRTRPEEAMHVIEALRLTDKEIAEVIHALETKLSDMRCEGTGTSCSHDEYGMCE